MDSTKHPFRLPFPSILASPFERLLGLSELENIYERRPHKSSIEQLLDHLMKEFQCQVVSNKPLEIPETGPLIVVANHPMGGIEGVALAHMLLKKRKDIKLLSNKFMLRISEFHELSLPIDILSKNSPRENAKNVNIARKHVKNGGCLLLFPAGRVARFSLKNLCIKDKTWDHLLGLLLKSSKASCLPIYIDNKNSTLFYVLNLFHSLLGTLLLPRELTNKKGLTLNVKYGNLIKRDEISQFNDIKLLTDYVRVNTEVLAPFHDTQHLSPRKKLTIPLDKAYEQQTKEYIETLSAYKLLTRKQYSAFCVPYEKMGILMRYIGISREVSFRSSGIGSGRDVDVDRFDPFYQHLFLWDHEKSLIVGGYRIGHASKIIHNQGIKALYSRSLYKFKKSYLKNIDNALEFGRSFVHPNYQNNPIVLDSLWRGIGVYLTKNPEYHILFGSVSISSEYLSIAGIVIAESLLHVKGADKQLINGHIKPLTPIKIKHKKLDKKLLASLSNVNLINKVVDRCAPGKSIPVLLRHYLSLNGKLTCFCINPILNSLDGFVIVDLRKTPDKYINRYLGEEGAENFKQKWLN